MAHLGTATMFATFAIAGLLAPAGGAETAIANAQTAPAAAPAPSAGGATFAPLLPPPGLRYRYWPLQIVQFLGAELPYSDIVMYVDERVKGQAAYDVALTERTGGKRIHYVNTPALVAEDKAKGDDAYLTRMQFDHPEEPVKDATYVVRFNTEKGVPVQWQFVEGFDLNEQGSGVTPIDAPIPIIMYRELAALAGEGTALKFGDVTSTADVWKEFAHPPYFIPFHGAISQGVHIVSMVPVSTTWIDPRPDTQPATLAEGAIWKLSNPMGLTLSAHVDSVKGTATTVSFADEARGTVLTIDAEPGATGWGISRIRFGPSGTKAEHTVSLVLTPAPAGSAETRFDLIAGKKTKLAAGSVLFRAGEDGSVSAKWVIVSPDWAKGKTASATSTVAK